MVSGTSRGHTIVHIDGEWLYADTHAPIDGEPRPCAKCGRLPTVEGYDACLGHIDGAKWVCCGHGLKEPYVLYKDIEEVD